MQNWLSLGIRGGNRWLKEGWKCLASQMRTVVDPLRRVVFLNKGKVMKIKNVQDSLVL